MAKSPFDVEKDYYTLLGVPPSATADEIRDAYRRRAKEFHPDQNPDHPDWAEAQFKELGEAYQVLNNSDLRRAYDQARWREQVEAQQRQRQQQQNPGQTSSPPPSTPLHSQTPPWLRNLALWWWVPPLGMLLILVIFGIIISVTFNNSDDDTESTNHVTLTPLPTIAISDDLLAKMPVMHNTDWEPAIRDIDGVEMVLVPDGCFIMGEEPPNEVAREAQRVCFENPFWIDRYEVTNGQYLRIIREKVNPDTTCQSKWCEDERPRESISWEDATTYCQLRGGSLPTAAQWEYAARGPDNLRYPWGNEFHPEWVIYRRIFEQAGEGSQRPETYPVGSRPGGASWVGAEDMLGNVQEWIADTADPNASPRARYVRGGSALNNTLSVTEEIGYSTLVRLRDFDGFRCVRY